MIDFSNIISQESYEGVSEMDCFFFVENLKGELVEIGRYIDDKNFILVPDIDIHLINKTFQEEIRLKTEKLNLDFFGDREKLISQYEEVIYELFITYVNKKIKKLSQKLISFYNTHKFKTINSLKEEKQEWNSYFEHYSQIINNTNQNIWDENSFVNNETINQINLAIINGKKEQTWINSFSSVEY